ncbi:MarR family winged helix-turn-helix transcriptional regulator [Fusobacterium ulcerans]|uniref:MarR family winged helix-turn-helix transcriptional regulator n=1 Tax=Fusobacterium ulcerans TaxID=861 RepID=UPI0010329510|nr:MarR family transcriptional regulator [Fusobacterium ulcerans]
MKKITQKFGYDFYIREIGHNIKYTNDRKLLDHNITNQQARLLGEIYNRLTNNLEISRLILSNLMNLSGPSVTSLLNGLEKNGFIIRHPGSEDERTIIIEITSKAQKLIDKSNDIFKETEKKLLYNFSNEEKKIFLKLLEKAYLNMS